MCFRQDEFQWVDASNEILRQLGVHVLFSVAGAEAARRLYGPNLDRLEIVQTLTGYVPDDVAMRPWVPLSRRPIDVGYRGRTLPFPLGRLAQEKVEIGARFVSLAHDTGLTCDIARDERSNLWRGVDPVPRVVQVDPRLRERREHRGLRRVGRAAVRSVLGRPAVRVVRGGSPGCAHAVRGNVSSPRSARGSSRLRRREQRSCSFGASTPVAVRPGEHYLPLEKDFSNFDEVVAGLRDTRRLEEMSTAPTRTSWHPAATRTQRSSRSSTRSSASGRSGDRRAEQHADPFASRARRSRASRAAARTRSERRPMLSARAPPPRSTLRWRSRLRDDSGATTRSTQRCSPVQRLWAPSRSVQTEPGAAIAS